MVDSSLMVKSHRDKLQTQKSTETKTQYLEYPRFDFLYTTTNQPEFADLHIEYEPTGKVLDESSFNQYLSQYRNETSYHEEVLNRIIDDLGQVLAPKHIALNAVFNIRGGIISTIKIRN